ncbi:MAG: tRNA uridine-5-carboxymethylaminomethyl(34) synthesis GTPase MnmE [Clostridiales bacterium]|nr:tRNA uridine-5-carboxymethylaminomethyl(34) synthesis GTPase MnmE [Clostridiales bacterium]
MSDTIAAIATGGAVTAIGIIRISGKNAISAADSIFRAKSGIKMCETIDRKLIYGELLNSDGAVIDICLCTVSRAPNSYTGEDTAEVHCHGSPIVLREGLRALYKTGIRQAEPGEFTKRAFLNGLLDLSQAEAVIDLIEAETGAAARNAAGQLSGMLSRKIERIYDTLLHISAHFFAVIDYPDEDVDTFELKNYSDSLERAEAALQDLLASFSRGDLLKNGVLTAIIGKPNVGKSSLLNALLGYERAIVTPVAGTTRDTIEEKVRLGNLLLSLTDTAGIREADDVVERLGIERARGAAESSRLVLAVFDAGQALDDDDRAVLHTAAAAPNRIAVINKSDLSAVIEMDKVQNRLGTVYCVSALTGEGIDTLAGAIMAMFDSDTQEPSGDILTNARQADAAQRALDSIRQAQTAQKADVTPDAILTEIETAMSALGEISGRTIKEDIAARIFERFCVGK